MLLLRDKHFSEIYQCKSRLTKQTSMESNLPYPSKQKKQKVQDLPIIEIKISKFWLEMQYNLALYSVDLCGKAVAIFKWL